MTRLSANTKRSENGVAFSRELVPMRVHLWLKFISIRKPFQNGFVPRRPEIFDNATKYWIEQGAGMPPIQIERHQFAIQMKLRLVVERVAVVILQLLLQRP